MKKYILCDIRGALFILEYLDIESKFLDKNYYKVMENNVQPGWRYFWKDWYTHEELVGFTILLSTDSLDEVKAEYMLRAL